jgi:hypothetical protein
VQLLGVLLAEYVWRSIRTPLAPAPGMTIPVVRYSVSKWKVAVPRRPDVTDFWGRTCLHLAAYQCHIPAMEHLISRRHVPSMETMFGCLNVQIKMPFSTCAISVCVACLQVHCGRSRH